MLAALKGPLPARLKLVAIAFSSYGNKQGENIFVSSERIARDLGVHPRTAEKHLRELRRLRFYELETPPVGQGRPNQYRIVRPHLIAPPVISRGLPPAIDRDNPRPSVQKTPGHKPPDPSEKPGPYRAPGFSDFDPVNGPQGESATRASNLGGSRASAEDTTPEQREMEKADAAAALDRVQRGLSERKLGNGADGGLSEEKH